MGKILKYLTLGLSTLLILVLAVDGMYIWRKKVSRIGGRVAAHILFLFVICGIIWFMSFGSIL